MVRFINGEIVSAARNGKLTVLNEELEVLKTFRYETERSILTLTGNEKYIAYGDYNGTVRYYNRIDDTAPRVSGFFDTDYYLQVYYHETYIRSIDIENEVLISGSRDSKIQAWNLSTSSQLFEVQLEQYDGREYGRVLCLKVVDRKFILCWYNTVRILDLKDGKFLHQIRLPDWCRNFDLNSQKTLLAVAHDEGVSIWNFSNLVKISETELKSVFDVRFNKAGTRLIVGQKDGQISKIDLY